MIGSRASSDVEILVQLRRDGDAPLHHQLEQQLRDAVRSGRLEPGSVLPSTRAFAADLGLSRGVVIEAYEQLIAEGYLTSRPGGATWVASAVTPARIQDQRPAEPVRRIDFRYGRPDVSEFPRQAWLRSLRRALNVAPNESLGYLDGHGALELRESLAAYLNRVRGTAADVGDVVICTGFGQGLSILVHVLRSRGARRVIVENPSEDDAQRIIRNAGLEVIGIPVDDHGLRVDQLAGVRADAVLVTPAHQFPTGGVLPPERRAALVAWAAERDALIIEDDYDAEYRYDRIPIGAIQGLACDRTVYAGSASKTLAPGLRLGWMVVPPSLVDTVADAKQLADRGSSILDQLAFADFLASGDFDRHLRRMRPIYRARRDALLDALERHLPELRPVGASAGLHLLAWLPAGLGEATVIEAAAERDIGVYGLAPYRVETGRHREGLIFGYASLTEPMIDEGVRLLAGAIAELGE